MRLIALLAAVAALIALPGAPPAAAAEEMVRLWPDQPAASPGVLEDRAPFGTIVRNVEDAGFVAKRRNMHYEILGDPFFRQHEVPRLLELSTARQEGDTSVPAELMNYPARSAAGKQQRRQTPISPVS